MCLLINGTQYTTLHCTDVSRDGYWNQSPLHWACDGGRKQVVQYLVERAHCDVSEYHDIHCVNLVKSQESVMISDHTHYTDVTDDDYPGRTPLDLATEGSTNTWADQDERKRCTEVVDYLKSLPTEHSESLLHHTLCPHITKVKWLLCDWFTTVQRSHQ